MSKLHPIITRFIICDGNGHISPARKTRFQFYHVFSHPNSQTTYQNTLFIALFQTRECTLQEKQRTLMAATSKNVRVFWINLRGILTLTRWKQMKTLFSLEISKWWTLANVCLAFTTFRQFCIISSSTKKCHSWLMQLVWEYDSGGIKNIGENIFENF